MFNLHLNLFNDIIMFETEILINLRSNCKGGYLSHNKNVKNDYNSPKT